MRRISLILMLLVMASGLHAQTLTGVLQNLENSLETLERGYTLVNSGLKTLREQQTQLSAELDTLETESTELERRLTSLEQSWSEQKQATDALTAAFNSEIGRLNSELWAYRIGGAILAGLVVWSFFR